MQGLSKEKIDAEDPRGMRKVFAETQRTGPGHTGEDVEQKNQHIGHQLPDEIEVTCTNSDVLCI